MTKNEIDLDFIGMCIAHANKKEKKNTRICENKVLSLLLTNLDLDNNPSVIHITLLTMILSDDWNSLIHYTQETLLLNSELLSLGIIGKYKTNILTNDRSTDMYYLKELTDEKIQSIFGDFLIMMKS